MKVTITTPPDFLLQQAALSDLFFNHEHERYAGTHRELDDVSEDELDADAYHAALRKALLEDATEFAENLRNATGICVEASELVEDYLARE